MYMLSKKFRSNKFYQVTRYTFKYGNEWDEMESTVTVWDTYEKAMAYIERYSSGLKFASAQIEMNNLDREITYGDYKKGDYNIVSFQKIYDVTLDGTEDTEPEEIIYMADKKEEQKAEKVAPQKGAYKVTCGGRMGYYFETLTEARAYAEKYASEDNLQYKIFLEIGRDIKEIETIKPPIKYYIVKGYSAQFSNLRAAINFAKGVKVDKRLIIYAVRSISNLFPDNNLEPICSVA